MCKLKCYVCILILYEFTTTNNMTRSICIHTFHIIDIYPQNKYVCHIAHICSTVLLLYSTYSFQIQFKKKTAILNNYLAIGIYVLTTNMLLWCDIWKLVNVQVQGNYVSNYWCHMNSLHSTIWPETLVNIQLKLLAYAPEQICLPNYTCMSHYMSILGCI